MYCKACGEENVDSASYCRNCGQPFKDVIANNDNSEDISYSESDVTDEKNGNAGVIINHKSNKVKYYLLGGAALIGLLVIFIYANNQKISQQQEAQRTAEIQKSQKEEQRQAELQKQQEEEQRQAELQKQQEEEQRQAERQKQEEKERTKFIGIWQADVIENGIPVRIIWKISANGGSQYLFYTHDGMQTAFGDWRYSDEAIYEKFQNGSTGSGSIEWINNDHFALTIIDNGNAAYTGIVRNYYRL